MSAQPRYTSTLRGSKVVIIGGTSGIGFAVASGLIEEGASVVVASSTQEKVDKAVARLNDPAQQFNADPARVSGFTVNASGPEAEASFVELFKQVGKFDHLIFTSTNFGGPITLKLQNHTFDTIAQHSQIRFINAIVAVKVAAYGGYLNDNGSVVLTGGSVDKYPLPNWAVNSAYAGAFPALVRGLAYDLSPRGIRANCVSPGAIMTEFWKDFPPEVEEMAKSKVVLNRVGKPEEIALSYILLIKNKNVTGITIEDNSGAFATPFPDSDHVPST